MTCLPCYPACCGGSLPVNLCLCFVCLFCLISADNLLKSCLSIWIWPRLAPVLALDTWNPLFWIKKILYEYWNLKFISWSCLMDLFHLEGDLLKLIFISVELCLEWKESSGGIKRSMFPEKLYLGGRRFLSFSSKGKKCATSRKDPHKHIHKITLQKSKDVWNMSIIVQ